jgi:ribonuclease D
MNRRSNCTKTPTLPPPIVVSSPPQLATLLDDLCRHPAVGVDTESNSLFAYEEQVCLIQLSTHEADYVIDPLNGLDVAPLGKILGDDGVEKVLHAAEYDVMCLKRDFGFCFANLFDTMWAARVLGWPRVGLGSVLKETFGVRSNKRFQRHDWGQRPLTPEALAYAAKDTHYLLPLRDVQIKALTRSGRLEEAKEGFAQIATSEFNSHGLDPGNVWRVKGVFDLSRREQAVLSELAAWRDKEARLRDRPHFKVLHDSALVALATARPGTLDLLARAEGVSAHHVRRYGDSILQAISRGATVRPPAPPPRPPRRPGAEIERFEALRLWRKQTAAERGVEPDVVAGNATLWALARRNPRALSELAGIQGLGPWRQEAYGKAIIGVLMGKDR